MPPEAHLNYGIAQMSEDELFEQARIATEAGISVAIHAIGDQANHHVLNVFERLRPITLEVSERSADGCATGRACAVHPA